MPSEGRKLGLHLFEECIVLTHDAMMTWDSQSQDPICHFIASEGYTFHYGRSSQFQDSNGKPLQATLSIFWTFFVLSRVPVEEDDYDCCDDDDDDSDGDDESGVDDDDDHDVIAMVMVMVLVAE